MVTQSLHDAVVAHVRDGDTVYVGNFGAQLFSVAHELIRQRRRRLHLVVASGGILMDQLLGAGVLSAATFGHCWGPVGPAPAHVFRRLAESGQPQCTFHEVTLGMLSAGLTAAAWGVPFMPVGAVDDTGYVTDDWSGGLVDQAVCRFGTTTVVRAIQPDIAFVHVDQADEAGNGVIRGPLGEALVAAQAARRVVVVAEEIVSTDTVCRIGITVPEVLVSAVVHQPGAVAPDGALGRYDRDVAAYRSYADASSTPEGFVRWAEEVVR